MDGWGDWIAAGFLVWIVLAWLAWAVIHGGTRQEWPKDDE